MAATLLGKAPSASWRLPLVLVAMLYCVAFGQNATAGVAGDVEDSEIAGKEGGDDGDGDEFDPSRCTVLRHKTTYKQEVAPTDITGLFNVLYDRVNEDLDDVVSVKLAYVGGVIHREVGRHDVTATVTRRAESGDDTDECMVVPVVIEDSNECTLPEDHPMRHECHPSADCVNTIGSYECSCPSNDPCIPRSGAGLCTGVRSTADCCAVDVEKRPNGCHDKSCTNDCRKDFRCYTDQCAAGKCVYPELCSSERGSVTCGCKADKGEVGNGHICPGMSGPVYTDTEGNFLPAGTDPYNLCGCRVPVVDFCHGVNCGQHSLCSVVNGEAVCVCKSGFRDVDGLGCMDDSAPSLVLKGPAHLTMKQCDKYVERGIQVLDSNSEDDDRNVGVSYSQPPGRCTPVMSSFTVNYTLNTEWTHPAVQYVVRHVTVEDVDECALNPTSPQAQCPGCRPQCHRHAKCENRVGTYACICPKCMSGDGFEHIILGKSRTQPEGYLGGTGCRDSCAPVISLIGDNPLILKVGINTDFSGRPIKGRDYTQDLGDLISRTNGGGLCEDGPGSRCAKVLDNNGTHARVDITDKLSILNPTQVSRNPLQWQVTYQAKDEAGNFAVPVIRTIEIQEMTMDEYANEKVEEALLKRPCPSCKNCAAGCPKPPPPPKQKPCSSGNRGELNCRDCPCDQRDGCAPRSEGLEPNRGDGWEAPGSCPSGAEGPGRGGQWCLPMLLTGGQQVVLAICALLGMAIIVAAAAR